MNAVKKGLPATFYSTLFHLCSDNLRIHATNATAKHCFDNETSFATVSVYVCYLNPSNEDISVILIAGSCIL